jgi:hypothetical protein
MIDTQRPDDLGPVPHHRLPQLRPEMSVTEVIVKSSNIGTARIAR